MNKKKQILNYKCNECKTRLSIDDLESRGYVEDVGSAKIIECPHCGHVVYRS